MSDQTLATLTAATPATGGLFYGTQSGADRKFTLTAAGAKVIEATTPPGGIKATIVSSDGQTLTAEQCYNGIIYFTGGSYLYLPPIAEGMSVTIIIVGTATVTLCPDSSDQIIADGSPLGYNYSMTNLGTNGDKAVLTYYSLNNWFAATNGWGPGV